MELRGVPWSFEETQRAGKVIPTQFFPAIRQEKGFKSTRAALGDSGGSGVFPGHATRKGFEDS